MKKLAAFSLASLAMCIMSPVLANNATIDYRQQYLSEDQMHSHRFKIGYRMDNGLGFEGELKYKVAGDRQDVALDNSVNGGHEFTVSYQFKTDPLSTWTPSFQIDSDSDSSTYKFGLKYNRKLSDSFYVAGRYRYEARRLNRDNIDESVPDRGSDNRNTNGYEGWLGYTPAGPWAFEYNYIYFDTDYIRYDNQKSDYEQNVIIKYKYDKNWTPFIEIGDVKVTATDDQRQMRWRAGIQYRF